MAITTITKRYFDDNFYIYDPRQYTELKIGTIVASSLSMVSSLLVIISYLYLTKYNASKAKRVSLRCVFMACVMNLMNAIFDITSVIGRGDTPYCRASNMIIMFGGAMCATFLAIVGINLVLVFVINVKINASKLERVYYPCGILYGLFTLAVPIYETARDPQAGGSEFLCYYYINYYQFDGHITLAWMWWYGFVFFIVIIAVLCSITALMKLMRELGNFKNVANTSATIEASNTQVQQRKESQSNIFLKVVSRCILYPLVPFACNICGFVNQLMLANPRVPTAPAFSLALADTVMSCLEGFFVAIIFFGDPVMTDLISTKFKAWKHKYVDEFSQVRKYGDGQVEIINNTRPANNRKSSNISSLFFANGLSLIAPPATVHISSSSSILNGKNEFFATATTTDIENCIKSTINYSTATTMSMRRVSASPSVYSRLTHLHPDINHAAGGDGIISRPQSIYQSGTSTAVHSSSSSTVISCFANPESRDKIMITYKYPKLASAIHWCLIHLGFKSKKMINTTALSIELQDIVNISPSSIDICHPLQHNSS